MRRAVAMLVAALVLIAGGYLMGARSVARAPAKPAATAESREAVAGAPVPADVQRLRTELAICKAFQPKNPAAPTFPGTIDVGCARRVSV